MRGFASHFEQRLSGYTRSCAKMLRLRLALRTTAGLRNCKKNFFASQRFFLQLRKPDNRYQQLLAKTIN
jgi:uncharacterized protein with von Willebrand factor type A (vWA) domain